MSIELDLHPLLSPPLEASTTALPEPVLAELRSLAEGFDQLSSRSRQLFEQLRKMLGQDRLQSCLLGIQHLAAIGDPAGARLLAALLDARTPGSQLMPRVQRFRSVHRLLVSDPERVGDEFLCEWQERLTSLLAAVETRCGAVSAGAVTAPLDRPPLPTLRHAIDQLLPGTGAASDLTADDMALLAAMVRLECDAYQERVSRLAGTIDPFRVTAVMRALPLLNRADGEIRDLSQLANWLEAGDLDSAFHRRIPREHEVLDESERPGLNAAYTTNAQLAPLAVLRREFLAEPTSLRHLVGPAARLLALGRALQRRGLRDHELDLVSAIGLVLAHRSIGRFRLDLPADLAATVGQVLMSASGAEAGWLRGLELDGTTLRVAEPQLGLGDRVWRHDLPTLGEMLLDAESDVADETDEGTDKDNSRDDDTSAFAVKQMVLNNVGSVSILLGFLRNQKVTSIPGLVADVVRRTRSGRVLEVVASDRTLYTGHPNKEVPRALLESPVNVSVKMLRRFIHVKYVSKTDLRRMARDKSRLRKEVCREIDQYLDSLS